MNMLLCVLVLHILFWDHASASLTCNFDNNLCSWTQRSDDQFDWIEHFGTTSDPTSGPEGDHTTGHGGYLLISGRQSRGGSASLSSPFLLLTHEISMTFWYHMNGVGIGNLTVITTDRYGRTNTIWQKQGRQSPEWQMATVTLGVLTSFITFEGNTRFHYGADLALDDIILSTEPIVYTTPAPSSTVSTTASSTEIDLSCDFENGMCNWNQDNKTDDLDWSVTHQRSPDPTSGPEGDHTNGNGNYLLFDGHLAHNSNWTARLFSPLVQIEQITNMTFWYHMNGVGIGHLTVFAEYSNSGRDILLSMYGRQGSEWKHVTVTLLPGVYKLIFEASARYHFGSNLALDDITVHSLATADNLFG